jgi:hypothetical protein
LSIARKFTTKENPNKSSELTQNKSYYSIKR